MNNNINIFNGDCFDVLVDIPDKSIDFILTYPPYELDNHGGGSTGIACMNTNRDFIGIEKLEEHFNSANERLINYKKE